jgi:hypothetical protein
MDGASCTSARPVVLGTSALGLGAGSVRAMVLFRHVEYSVSKVMEVVSLYTGDPVYRKLQPSEMV